MNEDRFDRVARAWATAADRRRLIRLLGTGLLAFVGSRRQRRDAAAQGFACVEDAECADGDLDPCTGATCVDGLCTYFIVDCIPGFACCGNGACCPAGAGGTCLTDADCVPGSGDPCEGGRCEGGTCVPFLVACAPGFACCGNGACCPVNNGCATDLDCAALAGAPGARTRCVSGVCVPAGALP